MTAERATLSRANPLVPAAGVVVGALIALAVSHPIGIGVAVGSALAFLNMLLLSGRVETAADTGDMGRALMVMQVGLVLTFTIIGVTTIILVKISVVMAVASAAGFGITQLAMLAVFYLTKGRASVAAGRQTP
ncbi:MAG TPA: hypothetical protein VFB58_10310 [Chloroflexota bacterium]|nr:hypothetical protein [Chloroflexota bacterium]